jgi:Lrp/AsnC family transcriptional regulator for asnA, asnC and gidA
LQEIDKIDQAIADLLIEDGRMPSAEIARRLGDVSERVVRYRLERMIEEGILRICAIPNSAKLGLSVVADVKINVEPGNVLSVARKLTEYENVTYVGCSIGEGDIGIQVVAPNNAELYEFITEEVGNVPGVTKTTTMIVPVVLKDIYQWSIPSSAVVNAQSSTDPTHDIE